MAKLSYDMALAALICVTIREEEILHVIEGFQPEADYRIANRLNDVCIDPGQRAPQPRWHYQTFQLLDGSV